MSGNDSLTKVTSASLGKPLGVVDLIEQLDLEGRFSTGENIGTESFGVVDRFVDPRGLRTTRAQVRLSQQYTQGKVIPLDAGYLDDSGIAELESTVISEEKKEGNDPPLEVLTNVTELSRSLIPVEYFQKRRTSFPKINKMSTRGFRSLSKRLSTRRGPKDGKEGEKGMNGMSEHSEPPAPSRTGRAEQMEAPDSPKRRAASQQPPGSPKNDSPPRSPKRQLNSRRSRSLSEEPDLPPRGDEDENGEAENGGREGRARESRPMNMFQRLRERSRSRSRSRSRTRSGSIDETRKEMLVAVTSCRSDGYYSQKAPGSTFKLPRKAPTNLKLFHELAVGVKDAYAAVGSVPRKPTDEEKRKLPATEYEARKVLWEFIGHLDFLLALVDEVAVDTVTRGALKDDSTFKGLRDVIKKGNRVLEEMLVRRERKYTLFFRLAQSHDADQIDRINVWNGKVEKAVGAVTEGRDLSSSENDSESESTLSSTGSVSSRAGFISRGRQLLPSGGRVRSRRATPTPRLRKMRSQGDVTEPDSNAAADGFSAVTAPDDLSRISGQSGELLPNDLAYRVKNGSQLKQLQPIEPKDELVDVIRGLRVEKVKNSEGKADDGLSALKPSWRPKADVPSSVPKLPTEYVHRHRLMKQVVSCLLDESEAQQNPDGTSQNTAITCITSRHGDKAGNGKSTLAIAVIQTVEVRERFADGIAWLKLGRGPLSERDIRRLYEDLYRQLIVKEMDIDASLSEEPSESNLNNFQDSYSSVRTDVSETRIDRMVDFADSVRRFQGGDLEGIKEDLGRMIVRRNILICLDDVWRVDDAKWFIFETPAFSVSQRESPYKILITTRIPALLGNGSVLEVFVRILSEHEAVKLLLSTAGRRPYGGRNSAVFNQSKMIVKGCGNSPLGILIVGSMLRQSSRNWNLKSLVWIGVFNQCSLNLEEAAQMRSFKNAFTRIVDMSFFSIEDPYKRIALRRCFVLFAMAFRTNDWMLSGKGIPTSVMLKFFDTVIAAGPTRDGMIDSATVITMLENLKILQRAMHSVIPATSKSGRESPSMGENSERSESDVWDEFEDLPKRKIQQFYTMHDSLKAVAERMAERKMPAFVPDDDKYTYFSDRIKEEQKLIDGAAASWVAPLRFLFDQLKLPVNGDNLRLTDEQVHELVAVSIVGGGDGRALSKTSISEAMRANQHSMQNLEGGEKFEEYAMSFLPEHLMFAKAHSSAADLLTDSDFVRRRVFALGIMEATARQVADVLDLRSFSGKGANARKAAEATSPSSSDVTAHPESPSRSTQAIDVDIDSTACEACRLVVDEVYKVTNSMGSSDSLGMATCLATVGETLLKCRQPRDAMLRLEEAVSIYRGLLGPYHVYVAHALHSVAKALTKIGETRVALLKFAEAARIYETCNATLHYDSISNAQALASLLVDIGDVRKAEAMFEEVIAMKQTVYGDSAVPVAKTINSYAILLAKHGRMKDALRNYEIARATYMKTPPSLISDPEFELRCSYDVTLITLNIASIYSKKGDLKKALQCYEDGVDGLQHYESSMSKIRELNGSTVASTKASSHKHVVAALGRIGSIKAKMGDNEGALKAYMLLIDQVDEESPIASHIEKAKAHIKCATIFRKREGEQNRETAVTHLRDALRMYKALHPANHKDTIAISTTLKQWLAEDKQIAK